ncbi:Hypothetical_protein [Hexamita inflata]|uniref:Hypothetical_protein n=1 Tax=Hexamita inflata TaxID=28002 RepID=A0AA86UDV5_9EUKA|nr:Hypothetical protein HINF_LOCUS34862 [Hexamita inflata]
MDNSIDRARQVITDLFIIDYLCTELDMELEPNRVRAHQTQEILIRDILLVSEMKALDDLAETMMELITHVYIHVNIKNIYIYILGWAEEVDQRKNAHNSGY